MMKSRSVVPTTEYLQSLYEKGDIKELQRQNEILAKRANERMRQLEKADFTGTAAYQRAQSFIDKSEFSKNNRFSRSKKILPEELFKQVKQEANFLRWQTSTVAGEMKRREKIFDTLTSQHINPVTGDIEEPIVQIPSNMSMNDFKKSFLDFLDSNAWEQLKKHLYYKDILNDAGAAVAGGASVESLVEAIKDYTGGDRSQDLIEIWDDWTKVDNDKVANQNEKNKR